MILAGGLGSRISHLSDSNQKCIIEFSGKPFLEYIIEKLIFHDIVDITLLLGHGAEEVIDYFGDGNSFSARISYSIEQSKLGTAGAIKNAISKVHSENFIAVNGDTYTDLNFQSFINHFENNKIDFGLCIKKPENTDSNDYAGIEIDNDGNIVSYKEKFCGSFMSCGIYYLNRKIFYEVNDNEKTSIEKQLIPRLLKENCSMKSFIYDGHFYDIGTENRLINFTNYIASI